MFKEISREEWKFLAVIWLIVVVIVFLPIIVDYFMAPPGNIFLFRRYLNGVDYSVYFSQIEQVKHGMYLFKDFFTLEPQPVGVLNPFWLSVGLFAKIFFIPSLIALHLASFLLIPFFLISAYYLISFFFEEKNKRKICFVFFVFASGISALIAAFFNFSSVNAVHFPSTVISGAFTFSVLVSSPHLIASLTLLILIFLFSLYAFERYKFTYSLWAGLCALFLFSFHPYHVYTVFIVLLAFLIAEFLTEQKIYFSHIAHYIILLVFSLPPLIYYLWAFKNIPVFYQAYFLENITLTPSLWVILFDYSVLLILAVLGVISFFKNKNINKRNIFLIVWAATQFYLIYLPINTQNRFLEGLNVPIMILAACGLFFLNDKLKDKTFYRLDNVFFIYLLICIFCMSNVLVFLSDFYFVMNNLPLPAYLSKDDENAMLWIKENTPEQSAILSWEINGNIMPVIAFRPVYLGHWSATVQFSKKEAALDDFFKKYNSRERKDFLKTNNINYLFWGPEEKKVANNFNPDREGFLQKVYGNNTAEVYKVN